MSLQDPIADMLVRIRTGQHAAREAIEVPHSRLKAEIARIMKREGYLKDYVIEGGRKKILRLYLKYRADGEPVIRGVRRESKAGRRLYVRVSDWPRLIGSMGVGIVSTSRGVMTSKEARRQHVGGELLCSLW
ncbi:MAG: 30S ribosomal protein S8 [Kiritimatiellia bacterium]